MKSREYEKRMHELSKLKSDYNKLSENYKHIYDELNEIKKIKADLSNKVQLAEMRYESSKFETQGILAYYVLIMIRASEKD
jgi:hypothetical protein